MESYRAKLSFKFRKMFVNIYFYSFILALYLAQTILIGSLYTICVCGHTGYSVYNYSH